MGGLDQETTPSPPHFYPRALQLKLYQAFIFSIPILFSIILFLLFYLFYLKRRVASTTTTNSNSDSNSSVHPQTLNPDSSQSNCEMGLKGKVIEKLPKVLFDEDLRARDSQCCVCLGEFEIKDELIQIPSCNHIFHADCIQHWFKTNSTCPLCRRSVISSTKPPDKSTSNHTDNNPQSTTSTVESIMPVHQDMSQDQSLVNPNLLREDIVIQIEDPSSS